MKKNVFGRKLKRDTHERKALFKGLASSLVMYERIQTTIPKAKAIKGMVDRIVTYARKGGQHGSNLLSPYLTPEAAEKLMKEITPRFADRAGGYTRIIKIGNRVSDNAAMAMMEWVEGKTATTENTVLQTENTDSVKTVVAKKQSKTVVARKTSGKSAQSKKTATTEAQKRQGRRKISETQK